MLICSIFFFLCTSVYLLSWSIFDINEEQKLLEDKDDTHIDVGEFRFEKDVLILFGVTISCVFLFGLIAVHVKSVCMLLFYSTTGESGWDLGSDSGESRIRMPIYRSSKSLKNEVDK